MEGMQSIIEREIEEYRQKYGEEALINYFNNFPLNLPMDYTGEKGERAQYYHLYWAIKGGDADRKHIDNCTYSGHSELYMNQTPREFYQTIDRVLKECGISIEEVKRLQNLRREDRANFLKHYDTLVILTLPAYIRLRELGYWHYKDLTG